MHMILQPTLANQPFQPARQAPGLGSTSADHMLIERIARGDRDAMRPLYGRYSTQVYRFALRFTGDAGTAEDIVSEVFVDVWRTAGAFQGRSKVSTWLLAITRHKAIAMLRRRSAEPMDDDAAETIQDASDDPEAALQKEQIRTILSKSLKQLSAAHREIIDLVYYHEKSIDEVARILNIPSATVKTRMFYARNRLRQMLAQAGHDRILH